MKKLFLIPIILLSVACNQSINSNETEEQLSETQEKASLLLIAKPNIADGEDIQWFTLSASEGDVIQTKGEAIIVIPKDAFVFEDGTPVSGKVDVKFEEFYNTTDIIASGIPMTVMVNNEPVPFISDGMFNIKATCQGKKVKVKKDKELGVFTPSKNADPNFKFWSLDESSGAWEKTAEREKTLQYAEVKLLSSKINSDAVTKLVDAIPASSVPVSNVSNLQSQLRKPTPPVQVKSSDFTFTLDVSTNKTYKELGAYKNVVWMPEEVLLKREQNAFASDLKGSGANIKVICLDEPDQLYELTYAGRKMKMRPVLLGADKAKAIARFKERQQVYDQKLAAEKVRLEKVRAAAAYSQKVYNYFAVNKMGVYNCDRYYSYKGNKPLFAFECNKDNVTSNIFAVLKNNKGAIALSPAYMQGGNFKLPADEIVGFVHTTSKGELMSAKPNDPNMIGLNKRDFTLYSPEAKKANIEELIASF